EGTAAALEARARSRQWRHGTGPGRTVCGQDVSAGSQGACAGADRRCPQRPEGANRKSRLDERGDQAESAGEVADIPAEDRLPGKMARLVGPEDLAGQLLCQR